MKLYTIYVDPAGHYKAVKQGWSWPAFLFTWVWAVVKNVWKLSTLSVGILAIACVSAFIVASAIPQTNLSLIVDLFVVYMGYLALALSFIMGAKGNQWLADNLLAQGYQHKGIIHAVTPAAAIVLYRTEGGKQSLMVA